jgi:hypothetical protein
VTKANMPSKCPHEWRAVPSRTTGKAKQGSIPTILRELWDGGEFCP